MCILAGLLSVGKLDAALGMFCASAARSPNRQGEAAAYSDTIYASNRIIWGYE